VILRLAHVEITAADLGAARDFYVDLLGFVEHHGDRDALYLRGADEFDAWSLKIRRDAGGGLVHSAFRVSDDGDLDRLERGHRDLGLATERVAAGTEPEQGEALRCRTPDGHAIEFFHAFDEIDSYRDGRLLLPVRRAHGGVPPARLDHVSMRVDDLARSLEYWIGVLGFSASEFWVDEHDRPRIAWLRRQPRSHDVALGTHEGPAFHHVAYAVSDPTALLRAADILGDARRQDQIEFGPSRHGATNAFAMYLRDADGNRLELYTGDYTRDLDRPPLLWRRDDYALQGHSWWGDEPPASFPETQPLRQDGWPA
jgi:catechol 2,3-dioxygenase